LGLSRKLIGIDFHAWDGIYQGSRSHLLGIYRAAIQLAPEFDFIFFLHDTEGLLRDFPEFDRPNVRLVKVKQWPSFLRLSLQLPWLSFQHRLDLLHMQYRVPLWFRGEAACTIHDVLNESHPQFFSWAFNQFSRLAAAYSVRKCKTLLTVSQYSRQELADRHGVALSRIGVTYNGVDPHRFFPATDTLASDTQLLQRLNLTSGQYVLTVGRLEPRKNQANLIRAWGALPQPAPPLVVVGQRHFSFQDIYAAQSEVGRPVMFLHDVGDHELPVLMRHAKLFAYPAYAEGFGMPIIEALASGVPVVTSNTTAMPEIAGTHAILVDPTQVASIQGGLAAGLALSGAEKETVIAAGLAQAAAFNWDSSAGVLIDRFRLALQHR